MSIQMFPIISKRKLEKQAFIILLSKGFPLCSISFSCTTKKNSFLSVGDWTILQHAQGHLHTNHNQGELVRSEPSLLLHQNSTIEYWNMLTFEPPHICFSNNSTWTCSKLPFKFPKPAYHNKEKKYGHKTYDLKLNNYNTEIVQHKVMPKQVP